MRSGEIFFSEPSDKAVRRGGRHVEFGFAMAGNKPIFVIGPKENIFHYLLSDGKHFADIPSFLRFLQDAADAVDETPAPAPA